MGKITIDPVTRIEGHLKIEAVVDRGAVKEARSSGVLFRGLEMILRGRDPRDAQQITQRVCGVCPAVHSIASVLAQDAAFGIAEKVPKNGRIMRNLILSSNFLQSHILHFYHLSALDFVDVAAVSDYEGDDLDLKAVKEFIARGELGPFLPRYEGDFRLKKEQSAAAVAHYVKALRIRRTCHEMLAMVGGKMPHNCTAVAGGVTEHPTEDKIAAFIARLDQVREFIDNVYIPDVLMVAKAYPDYLEIGAGPSTLLSWGVFDLEEGGPNYLVRKRLLPSGVADMSTGKAVPADSSMVAEDVRYSRIADSCAGRPAEASTEPQPDKPDAYSFMKAPRYDDRVCQVGPSARVAVAYLSGNPPEVKKLVDWALSELNAGPGALLSTAGRHLARAIEAKVVADAMAGWVLQLNPGEPVCADYRVPAEGEGAGLVDGPRGALGHWLRVKGRLVDSYQLVVPTTWNASPRDAKGRPGAIEQALVGVKVKNEKNPVELARIVRSFDPCLACAVHAVDARGNEISPRLRL